MIDLALKKLARKHLLIIGGTKPQRQRQIDILISKANLDFFRFPIGMKTIDEYVSFVRKENLYRAWYDKNGKFGSNQLLDFHRDWILENNVLIIMEEIQEMEEGWKMDLLGSYAKEIQNQQKTVKTIRLIVTQDTENDLLNNLADSLYVHENEKRTKRQIVDGVFEVIELD
mgnify:CR=1 FL=1